jgi:ABC-type branched-subunit amino acid transport system permease subunit
MPTFTVGALVVTPAYSGMLLLTPFLVIGVALFLRYSRYGMHIRASAANPEAARLAGVFASRMSMLSWAIAGGVAAFTAILVYPTQGFVTGATFGPGLLLRALAAAVIGRLTNLPVAFAAGIGVGVVEQVLLANNPNGGTVQAMLFAVILVTLLFQKRREGRGFERGAWAAVQGIRPLPAAYSRLWTVRLVKPVIVGSALLIAVAMPLLVSASSTQGLTDILALALAGISVGIVTGLAGQLSLGQFAFAGIGALAAYQVQVRTGDIALSLLAGGAAAACAAVAVAIPALRIRGLLLAVTTLGFAVATGSWLLQQSWALGSGVDLTPVTIGLFRLNTAKTYYYLCLAVVVIGVWLASNVRRGGLGRIFIAIRDNEEAAQAFTINVVARKLQAYAIAGFLAGVAGALYAFSLSRITINEFGVGRSIDLVAIAVIGGIGTLSGPILGALYIYGIPQFLPLDSA